MIVPLYYCSFFFFVLSFYPVVNQVTTSGPPVLGLNNYTLTCKALVANHLCPCATTYQWTKNNIITELEVETESNTLSFSPLMLSDAGQYTCQATIWSFHINDVITVMQSQDVRIQSESSLML